MSELRFDCPSCKQTLEAEPDLAGEQIECPNCGQVLIVPSPEPPPPEPEPVHRQFVFKRPSLPSFRPKTKPREDGKNALLHLVSFPTVFLVGIALALPFMSVSCNRQKVTSVKASEIAFAGEDSQANTKEISEKQNLMGIRIGLYLVMTCALLATLLSLAAARGGTDTVVKTGAGACIAGLIILAILGYYVGVRTEQNMKTEQAKSLQKSEGGFEAMGAAFAASMDLSVEMDAGYYLLLAALLLGTGGFVVPSFFRKPQEPSRVVAGSVISTAVGLSIVATLIATFTTLASPAKVTSKDDLANFFDDTKPTKETSNSGQPAATRAISTAGQDTPPAARTPFSPSAPETKQEKPDLGKLEPQFLGLSLGCSVQEAKDVLAAGPKSVTLVKTEGSTQEELRMVYQGSHTLEGPSVTILTFWKGKLYFAGVLFSGDNDDMKRRYEVLKHKVTEKYGKEKDVIAFGDQAEWHKGGVIIGLKREIEIMKDGTVLLMAYHRWLQDEVEKNKLNKEAKALGEL